jgi:hypothetical protein
MEIQAFLHPPLKPVDLKTAEFIHPTFQRHFPLFFVSHTGIHEE